MKTRILGATGRPVTEIGLGAWQLGSDCWGDVDDATASQILSTAEECGIRFIDTADVYGAGLSERRVGRFLRSRDRSAWFVATKIGRFPEPGWPGNFTREAFRTHAQASLERLGTYAIDLLQLHCIPTQELVRGACFDWLRELQAEGVVRHWGASVESVEQGLLCLTQPGCAALQIIFNALRPKPLDILLPRCAQMRVAVIVRLPLASGLLAANYTKGQRFAPNDHRTFNRDGAAFNVGETFAGLPLEVGIDISNRLRGTLPEGWSMAEAALRWVLDEPAVTVVIPGATKPGQVRANARASVLPALPAETRETWLRIARAEAEPRIRGPY